MFKDSFQIYIPAEYLSGDFYWVAKKGNLKFAAVGDCTGHGVSAAFLSMIGFNSLNHAVHNKGLTSLNEILIEIDKQFIEAFSSYHEDFFDNDWIDMSIISYDEDKQILRFAGANRKILVITNGTATLLKGARYPIGGWQLEKNRTFPIQELKLKQGFVYMGSDGFQDQYNKDFVKKIGSKKLHKMIFSLEDETMKTQKNILEKRLSYWMGGAEQTDDICLVGIKI